MVSIKTNFLLPSADNPEKQGQRLAQDLSSNFKAITKALGDISSQNAQTYGLDGVEFSTAFSFSIPYSAGSAFQQFTFSHGFGVIPSAFLTTDVTFSTSSTFQSAPTIVRTAWTTTTITVRIYSYDAFSSAGATNISGTFKILVLR